MEAFDDWCGGVENTLEVELARRDLARKASERNQDLVVRSWLNRASNGAVKFDAYVCALERTMDVYQLVYRTCQLFRWA